MNTLTLVILWVLPSVLLAVGVGFYLGRALGKQERTKTMNALLSLLQTTETLTNEVDSHTSDLQDVERSVENLDDLGELNSVQAKLLEKIAAVIESNQRLEDDLVCAKYCMEEQAQELDRTRLEARTDVLSGVANRKAFDETLKYWLSKSNREADRFALVMVDIDHFKWINDTHGHAAGDKVVTHVGKFLKERLRDEDYVARYGGDEFVILLAHIDMDMAAQVAERIRVSVERTNFDAGKNDRVSVTFSMGLSISRPGDSSESLIERADKALYRSKGNGRNQLHCYADPPSVAEVQTA